ncbi:hypothetical protein TNCV_121521 [Trichonephila clavipes]|nr:hypothetical protein TNCV_121521 [Trichonephila clavipes]
MEIRYSGNPVILKLWGAPPGGRGISIDATQEVAVTNSEIVEAFKASTPNNYLENPAEKNSLHDVVFADTDPTAVSSEESTANPLPDNCEENAVDSNKRKKKRIFKK